MVVNDKLGDDPEVFGPQGGINRILAKARYFIDPLPLHFYRNRDWPDFYLQWLPDRLAAKVDAFSPDIVHVHWISSGFMQIESLPKFNKPVVWTVHDIWPATGGCMYTGDCWKFLDDCGACPALGSKREYDLSRWVMKRKQRAWRDVDLTLVSYGSWVVEAVRKTKLFANHRAEFIMSGLDTNRFKPIDKRTAREALGLPQDRKLILFVSAAVSAINKGFHFLQQALESISPNDEVMNNSALVVVGASDAPEAMNLTIPSFFLGKMQDDYSLVLAYSAADVFVTPSYREPGPQTINESMACGTPAVAFNIGGPMDRIDDKKNGRLAEVFDFKSLSESIRWVIEDDVRLEKLSRAARHKAETEFGLQRQAESYLQLYAEILDAHHR